MISQAFEQAKSQGRPALMPFLCAGDPDLPTTGEVLTLLADAGADLIEVGFPYSDPIADGPVIQSAYSRALANGISIEAILATLSEWTSANPNGPPVVGMVSYSLIFRRGPATFVSEGKAAGLAGLIVPDLPGEESAELAALAREAGLDLIPLLAPTTNSARAEKILANTTGFVYCISVAGTTGERTDLPDELQTQLRALREMTKLPLAVGFGISRPEQVAAISSFADGVIVGSAIVRRMEGFGTQPREDVLAELRSYVESISRAG